MIYILLLPDDQTKTFYLSEESNFAWFKISQGVLAPRLFQVVNYYVFHVFMHKKCTQISQNSSLFKIPFKALRLLNCWFEVECWVCETPT